MQKRSSHAGENVYLYMYTSACLSACFWRATNPQKVAGESRWREKRKMRLKMICQKTEKTEFGVFKKIPCSVYSWNFSSHAVRLSWSDHFQFIAWPGVFQVRKLFWNRFLDIFSFILLIHEGSHREVYREFQPSYGIFSRWCQGLIRPQVPCTAPVNTGQLVTLH